MLRLIWGKPEVDRTICGGVALALARFREVAERGNPTLLSKLLPTRLLWLVEDSKEDVILSKISGDACTRIDEAAAGISDLYGVHFGCASAADLRGGVSISSRSISSSGLFVIVVSATAPASPVRASAPGGVNGLLGALGMLAN